MRRQLALALMIVLLLVVGCTAAVEKRNYVLRLIEWCAQVNTTLADIDPTTQPGRYEEEIDQLVERARDEPAPQEDRETLQVLLTSFEETADRFGAAEQALNNGDDTGVEEQLDAAFTEFDRTSGIAQEYGMPPLTECDEHVAGELPSPEPSSTTVAEEVAPAEAPSATPEEGEETDQAPSDVADGWSMLTDARLARQQVAVAEVDGLIYVAGGIEDRRATARVEAFDTAVNSWRAAPDLPVPLHHAMAVSYRGELMVLGGWQQEGNDLNATVSDRVFVLRNGEWVDFSPLNRPRAAGAAAVVDDHIVVAGGQADNELVRATDVYHGHDERWRDGRALPTPREHLAMASDGRYVYAVGGRELTADRNVAALERYEPAGNRWEALAPMPTPRGSIDADVVDGRLVVVGGETATSVLGDVEGYDIVSDTWSSFPSLSVPRHGMGVVTNGSVIYALHGAEATSHTQSSVVVEALRPPPRRLQPTGWRATVDAPVARQQVAVAEVGGVIWVAGGLETSNEATAVVQGLDPAVDQWRTAPELPFALHHAMAVNYRGELVVLGGWVARSADTTAEVSDGVFVLREGTWEELAPLNHARAAAVAAVVDDRIVVAGGQADGDLVAPTEVYDGDADSWEMGADIPTPREHLAGGSHGGYLYAAGGRKLTPDENVAVLERYKPADDRWETMTPMPTARGSIGAAVVEDRLVVVSGETSADVLGTVEMYDFASDSWDPVADLPTPRHGPGVVALGPTLYVMNGAASTSHTASTPTVEALDFQ